MKIHIGASAETPTADGSGAQNLTVHMASADLLIQKNPNLSQQTSDPNKDAVKTEKESSQVYTETTDNHTEAYRMCSGSQQGRTGVDGDGGGGSI